MLASTAFSFVLANFGIAIAARMPMMTTTINSSIRVKPLRVYMSSAPMVRGESGAPKDAALLWPIDPQVCLVAGRGALCLDRGVRRGAAADVDAALGDGALQRQVARLCRPPT